MSTDEILTAVRDFADQSHGDQMRKYTPDRYIVHPERVMKICKKYTDDPCILSAALLHDVLEDTSVSRDQILNFLKTLMSASDAVKTLKLVEELTDVYVKDAYPQYNRKKRKELELARIMRISKEAQTIKYADILDNCREIVKHDRAFAGKFLNECRAILYSIRLGEKELHERSLSTVQQAMQELRG